jgi:type IV secretory pathway VirB9-like protein
MKSLRPFLAVLLLSLSALSSWAQDAQARTVKYAAKDIVRVTARPSFTTLIVLPESERILDFVIGDKDSWVLEGTQNFAYLKPSAPGLSTSVTLITAAGNVYSFYAHSVESGEPDLKLFIEPTDERILGSMAAPPRFVPAAQLNDYMQVAQAQVQAARQEKDRFVAEYPVKNVIFDYKFDRDKSPFNIEAIWHDDKFTYIRSTAHEKPTLYEVKDDKPNLVNFDLRDGVYVVASIVDKGYLTIGKKKSTFERQAH